MERRTYQTSQSNKNTYYTKMHNIERKPNKDIINKLFLLVEEGNIFKIKEYLLSNNLTTSVRNNLGESLILATIKSNNLTKDNKLELIKYLIERGTPIDLADENNVTPIHIASKLQLKDIVDLLINAGANVNVFDNQGMTPLHYQLMSEDIGCKTKQDVKIGPIVPKINREQLSNNLKDISSGILSILYNDDDTNRYIKHIRNTIRNLHNLFPEYLYAKQNTLMLSISNKITDYNLNKDILVNDITNLIVDFTNTINEFVVNELKNTLNKLDIHPNFIDGWGPDNIQENRILKYKNIDAIIEEIDIYIDRQITDFIIRAISLFNSIGSEINKLDQFYYSWKTYLIDIYSNHGNIPLDELNDLYRNNVNEIQNINIYQSGKISVLNDQQALINGHNYFISIYKVLLNEIGVFINYIRINLDGLRFYFNKKYNYDTYNVLCSNIIVYIQNVILYLIVLSNEAYDIRNHIPLLQQQNEIYNQQLPNIYNKMTKYLDDMINNINQILKIVPSIYSIIVKFITTINNGVSIINMISAFNFIKLYHNNLNDNFYITPNTNRLNNLYDRSFQSIPLLPPTLLQYQNDITFKLGYPDKLLNDIKQKIWELYLPQFTFLNYASYYTAHPHQLLIQNIFSLDNKTLSHIDPIQDPKIGYAITYISQLTLDFKPELKYNNRTKYYTNDNNNLHESNNNMLGQTGINLAISTNKSISASPCISILLDRHLYIIKYIIIQYIISKVNQYLNPTHSRVPRLYYKLIKEINNYKKQYDEKLSLTKINNSIIYTLLGRVIDSIIINFIRICINETVLENISKNLDSISNIGEFYSDIANMITHKNKTILLNAESNYDLNLNEIIEHVITKFFNQTLDPWELNFTVPVGQKEAQINPNQHVMYNYSFNNKSYTNRCYIVDPDITKLLINNNARINQKDFAGNVPLYYSIDLQNLTAIKILLDYNASINNDLSRNLIGITPLYHALKLYLYHLEKLQDISKLSNELVNKINLYIEKKPEYRNNILEFTNNIFKEILFLINHQFYLLMRQYKKDWTFDKQKDLNNLFNMDNPKNKTIPLLLYDRAKIKDRGVNGAEVLVAKKEYINIRINHIKKNKTELLQQIKNLNQEKDNIQSKISDSYYKQRNNEINNLILNLTRDVDQIDKDLINLNIQLQKVSNSSSIISNNNSEHLYDRTDNFITPNTNDVVVIYEDIFNQVVNNNTRYTANKDLITYLMLWDNYINDPERQDNIFQLHISLIKYQYNLINNFINNHHDLSSIQHKLQIINDLNKNIIEPFALDYEELPVEYNKNTNYALTIILDIIVHVVRQNLCTMLYNITIKLLTKYVDNINDLNIGLFTDEQYSNYITGMIENIVSIGKENESILMKYIVGTLPKKLVKFVLQIYEDDIDPDKSITSLDQLFGNIINILNLIKTVPLNKDTIIVKQLQTSIFPYFKDIFELYIKEIKNMIDSYMKYIIIETKQIEIITTLLQRN